MKALGNLIWIFVAGLWSSIIYLVYGFILCITIIGIPFGKQCFKLAGLTLAPFGQDVDTNFSAHPIANIIWIIFGGLHLALLYLVIGLTCCVTIIGIPFGIQCFKLAKLSLIPFGANL